MFAASKSGSVEAKDPQFNYVTMLLHGDGTNGAQNNTFLDSSTNNFTITRNGNTTQGTFSPYGSNWSANFASSSTDYLSAASNAAFAFGTGDFTMEAFVFATASQTDNWIIGLANNCWFRVGSGGALEFYNSVASTSTLASTALPLNTWTHVAVVRSGTALTIYQNGVSVGTATVSTNFSSSVACTIGNQVGFDRRWNGYISNARVVKGTAVYTSAFTPSTTPLTAITNTSLLTCQSNRFIDNSSNAFTLTVSGTPSVQRFSPFSPTTAYSTSVIGGSGYFDGSGDYLSIADANALDFAGDFTVEAWVYVPSTSASARTIIHKADTNVGYALVMIPAGNIEVQCTSLQFNSTSTLPLNQWNHVALVRSGSGTNNVKFYLNGVQNGQGTNTSDTATAITLGIGAVARSGAAGVNPINGFISDVREVSSAVYTAAFTPPTAPLTAITNTSLLLNYTNAGILDNAMMNDLETVGNAQISTSVKKYGTGSIAFDGTGDLLVSSPKNILALGGGNFTIEMWIYPNNVSTNEAWLVAQTDYASNTGWSVFLNNNIVKFRLGNSGGTIQSSASVVASAWQHLALSRVGTTLTMYLDGTSIGSGTVNNFTDANLASVVGGITTTTGWNNNLAYNGYIDDLRITKGVARYTSSFTAPTAAFADKG